MYNNKKLNLKMLVLSMLVVQACLTLCSSVNCSPPGSSGHGILQGIVPTQGLNPCLLHCGPTLHPLSHLRSPITKDVINAHAHFATVARQASRV